MRTGPSGKQFDDEWREIPDDTPRSVSVDLRPKSMEQMVATYVAQAMALQAKLKGEEVAGEAEDLEVDDEGEDEILTPYELHAMAAEAERDVRRRMWLKEQIAGKKKVAGKEKPDPVVASEVKPDEKTAPLKAAPDDGKGAVLSTSQGAPGSR